MILTWSRGLLRKRASRLAVVAAGIAVAVALLGSLGTFLAASKATMTRRAAAEVAVDWQVEETAGADPNAVLAAVRSAPGVRTALPVGFGRAAGFSSTGTTTQTTGPGVVLGVPDSYARTFPGELRLLAGSATGALLAQQTAANLHAAAGRHGERRPCRARRRRAYASTASSTCRRPTRCSRRSARPPARSRPRRPTTCSCCRTRPWHQVFDPLAKARPDLVTTQLHVARSHRAARRPRCRLHGRHRRRAQPGGARLRRCPRRRQPRRGARRGTRGRRVRPGAVPVPRPARRGPGGPAHRGRHRRRSHAGGAVSRRCCGRGAPRTAS